MAFQNRLVEHPGRVVMTPVTGAENTYDMTPAEGEVYTEGTLLDAENMNTEINDIINGHLPGLSVDDKGNYHFPNIQAGSASCPVAKKDTNYSVWVTFPKPFSVQPYVVATPAADSPNSTQWCVSGVTTNGFWYRCRRTGAWNSGFNWIAIGV